MLRLLAICMMFTSAYSDELFCKIENGKAYVAPGKIYVAPEGIFLNTEEGLVPLSGVFCDEQGVFIEETEAVPSIYWYCRFCGKKNWGGYCSNSDCPSRKR